MTSPYTSKLSKIQIMVSDLVFAAQVAFFIGIVVAVVVVLLSLFNLVKDFKKRVLEARRGIFNGFTLEEVEVKDSSTFPGNIISCTVGGFAIVCVVVTVIFTFLCWPMFWLLVWSQ